MYGLLIIAKDIKAYCIKKEITVYHALFDGYDDYLGLNSNFDGTCNSMSILGRIYLSGNINIEIYTLKEIMQQPDRAQFEKLMHEEIKAMFENNIWTKVSRQAMFTYYNGLQKAGKDIMIHYIIMICSFKRKRHPYGRLTKYKARLFCHGGQQQWRVQYWETYSPVVSQISVRSLSVLSKLHNMNT